MGRLKIPPSGTIYIDTPCLIYFVERNVDFYPILLPMWEAARSGAITIVSSELLILRDAAKIRAKVNLKTADAIHVATALSVNADLVVTNDRHFACVNGLNVQILSDL